MTFTRKELVHEAVRHIRQYIELCRSEQDTYYLTRAEHLITDMWELGIIKLKEQVALEGILRQVRETY